MGRKPDKGASKFISKKRRSHPGKPHANKEKSDENGSRSPAAPERTEAETEYARKVRLEKNKGKHAKLSERRKLRFELERKATDAQLRTDAAPLLWKLYREWAGERLTDVEATAEKWSDATILSVGDVSSTSLVDVVRNAAGGDYGISSDWVKGTTPGVAALVLAASAVRAVQLAPSLYDGTPVAKLFSKHLKVDEQRSWLQKHSRKSLVRSAVGTAKRVHMLCDAGHLTMAHTKVIVIDCQRDAKKQNILDMSGPRNELFSYIHDHVRPLLKESKLKIVIQVPLEDEQAIK